jgi:hypothetical protein
MAGLATSKLRLAKKRSDYGSAPPELPGAAALRFVRTWDRLSLIPAIGYPGCGDSINYQQPHFGMWGKPDVKVG